MLSHSFGAGDLLLSFQHTPMFAINHFLSNSLLSSKTPPPTLRLGKPLHPPPNPPSPNVRSITPAASSVFRKSLRCTTSGLNSPNPRGYKVYNHGPSSFSSLWLRCATPRAEGPSALARPKHTNQFTSFARSSLSTDRSPSFFATLLSAGFRASRLSPCRLLDDNCTLHYSAPVHHLNCCRLSCKIIG